jgi:hypothetical protein
LNIPQKIAICTSPLCEVIKSATDNSLSIKDILKRKRLLLREQEEEADKEKVLSKGNIYENIVFVSNEEVASIVW